MKWIVSAALLVALVALGIARWERAPEIETKPPASAGSVAMPVVEPKPVEPKLAEPGLSAVRPRALTATKKGARVEKIRADYDAIRKGVADELAAVAAASAAGPGPFGETQVFLRRLALLEREQRADVAQVLDERELEDFELRESSTGQLVTARLGATTATEAQRRAVFRIRRDFDDRYGFVFELAREALVERERARKEMDGQIRAVLGEDLFAGWAAGDVR